MPSQRSLRSHCHALALYLMFYNFCRIYKTLKIAPAMAVIVSKVWKTLLLYLTHATNARRKRAAPKRPQ
jgi:hypothetical protein